MGSDNLFHKKKEPTLCCLTVALLLLLNSEPLFGGDNCFPGKEHFHSSPSQNYQLIWREVSREGGQVEPHHLLFRQKQEKEPHEFFEFYSEVCVHWSPDEKYFSISHLIGSNIAEDYMFETGDISHRINIMDLLPQDVNNYFRKGILHGYIQTVAWNKDGLFIRAFGDRENEPRAFDLTLMCTMEKTKWVCMKTANQVKMESMVLPNK